ncbi:biotin transporter BioY [Pannus brasiliensis CCIBt3594]|uniref:Biotin transporter n=2 Tax=Pannus TaxID=1427526 RepID=A0AAW9QT35_9CHRO
MSVPNELLWAFIGLLLTIFSTFVEASIAGWSGSALAAYRLGVTYQIGAVLFIGCAGGRNAALISQIAYVFLGLTWLPVFAEGGGLDYLEKPSFGYILGFIPGAAICGWWSFRSRLKLETLGIGALFGLLAIHLVGILYTIGLFLLNSRGSQVVFPDSLPSALVNYSVLPFPGQLVVACAAVLLAFFVRKVLFY